MTNKLDYYELLGVTQDASADEIKRAFRALARKYHPDAHNAEASEELFQLVSEAYEVLSDPVKREEYDDTHGFIKKSVNTTQVFGTPTWDEKEELSTEKPRKSQDSETGPTIWNKVSRIFTRPQDDEADEDTNPGSAEIDLRGERIYSFTIDALESIQGTTRELALPADPAPRIIRVRIPAGIPDGALIRIKPSTNETEEGVIRGRVTVIPHEFVSRDENDITVSVPITVGEALSGASLEVPTLNGPMQIQLPPCWNIEQKLRVRGKGLKSNENSVGDLFFKFFIIAPDKVNSAVEQFAKECDRGYSKPVRRKLPSSLK